MEVSPYTATYIRPILKVPMITVCIVLGIQSGIATTSSKFVGEMLESNSFGEYWLLGIFFAVLSIGSAILCLLGLNFIQKYYEQIDIIPTY